MERKLNILVDCDNVLNNLAEAVLNYYNKDWGDNLTINNITSYYMENFVVPQARESFYKYFYNKKVWKTILPIEEARFFLEELRENSRVYLCTKTEPANATKKAKWCERKFGFNQRKDFILTPNKKMIKGDILIDDCSNNFGGQKYSICLDRPWNRDFVVDDITNFRAENWEEIFDIVNYIIEKEGGKN